MVEIMSAKQSLCDTEHHGEASPRLSPHHQVAFGDEPLEDWNISGRGDLRLGELDAREEVSPCQFEGVTVLRVFGMDEQIIIHKDCVRLLGSDIIRNGRICELSRPFSLRKAIITKLGGVERGCRRGGKCVPLCTSYTYSPG